MTICIRWCTAQLLDNVCVYTNIQQGDRHITYQLDSQTKLICIEIEETRKTNKCGLSYTRVGNIQKPNVLLCMFVQLKIIIINENVIESVNIYECCIVSDILYVGKIVSTQIYIHGQDVHCIDVVYGRRDALHF